MWNPWEAAEHLTGWTITRAPTPGGGRCDWATKTITLDPGLPHGKARAVLTHELVHAWRGPFPAWARAKEERLVRGEAARLLIELPALLDAVVFWPDLVAMADVLSVDVETVLTRLEVLTVGERGRLEVLVDATVFP